jgi:CoA-transferase family III
MTGKLLGAIASVGDQLSARSGGRVSIDPRRLLERDASLCLQPPGRWSPNRHSQLIEASDGWIAVSLPRDDDRNMIPAWTECAPEEEPWAAISRYARMRPMAALRDSAVDLHLPVAIAGEAEAFTPFPMTQDSSGNSLVVDLSALWAGPSCAALLCDAGLDVVKIESPLRRDPTPLTTPELDQRINGGKRKISLNLRSEAMAQMIAEARVLVTSARPHALARLGITPEHILSLNPGLLWIAITAHGWTGPAAMRVGFGDDCAAAGGLLDWQDGSPRFMGDALADPLTGLLAANYALNALDQGQAGLLDVPLSGCAAWFAQATA